MSDPEMMPATAVMAIFAMSQVRVGVKVQAAHCAETMAEFQGLLLALEPGWEPPEPLSAELEKVGTSR